MKKLMVFLLSILITTFNLTFSLVHAQELESSDIDLIVVFNDNNIDYNVEKTILQSGGQVIKKFSELGSIEVKCKADVMTQIKSYPTVESISPNHTFKLSQEKMKEFNESSSFSTEKADLYNMYQWDIKKVTNNGKSFDLESGNHNVIVGIIDSGVNKNHPDLKANFLGGENFIPKGFEDDSTEMGDPSDIDDSLGHGTHIAGTIAGNGRIMGVAPNMGFKSYRIFNSQGNTTASIVSSAIIKATNDGVKVINLSVGGYNLKGKCFWTDPSTGKTYKLGDDIAEYSLYKRAIQYAVKKGVTVVASAGNESLDCSDKTKITEYLNAQYSYQGFEYQGVGYEIPGSIKGVITVSATGPNDEFAPYSNYGSNFIDISAPGGNLIINISDMCLSTYQDGYMFAEGTSMAAPKVSAVAALIICKYENINPKDVVEKIYKSAETLDNDDSSPYFGHGLVNAYNVLNE